MVHKIIDGTLLLANIRADFPNTSFPADLSLATMPDGYVWVKPTTPPECNKFERVEQANPTLINGAWVQQWQIVPWSDEEKQDWRSTLSCGPLQLRKALRQTGDYAAVIAIIAQADEETQEAWEYASEVRRLDPMIEGVRLILNKTPEEVEDIFTLALTL